MRLTLSWLVPACALLAAGWAGGDAPPPKKDRYKGADALAGRIDKHLQSGWTKAKVTPAAAAGDGEFLRRVYLDLAGRIPSVTEARKFLADKKADKRARLVEHLLASPRYASHFSQVWRSLLVPEASSNLQVRFQMPAFERWLFDWLQKDRGYDWMARELLTLPINPRRGRAALIGGSASSPGAFYAAKEFKAEELAGAAAHIFLGVNIGCAQCHNHPFAKWKREQFWSQAAFFSGIRTGRQGDFTFPQGEQPDRHEITIPNTNKKVKAKFLDGKSPTIEKGDNVRKMFADWMTTKDNPYFARAAVNRLWAHFFGTGLVEPLDEMAGGDNKASHPELLDDLAKEFAEHKFDLKYLIRAITSSKAYQLTSAHSHDSQKDPRQFAKAALRGLTGEQLFDSIVQATGFRDRSPGGRRAIVFGGGGARGEFLTKFASASERSTDVQTSILQALSLMNGQVVRGATNLRSSETLAAVADAPFMTTRGKVETLFLATLSRKPNAKELGRFVKYVENGGAAEKAPTRETDRHRAKNEALADVFWVLLNSTEFVLNH